MYIIFIFILNDVTSVLEFTISCSSTFHLEKLTRFWPLQVTNEGLEQGYCIVPCSKRFILLYSFLKRNLSKKVMVFFSSCNSVKFHSELLCYINVPCFDIHGKQKQQKRTSTFFDFCKADKGILLCTDVAARGLDIPAVVSLFSGVTSLSMTAIVFCINYSKLVMLVSWALIYPCKNYKLPI